MVFIKLKCVLLAVFLLVNQGRGTTGEIQLEDVVNEMMQIKEELNDTKHQLKKTREELSETKRIFESNERHLESFVILRDPPYTIACGWKDGLSTTSQPISYTTLLYSSSNVEGAGLDISTGVFTAGHPGSYTITWSLWASDYQSDDYTDLFLRKNGDIITESQHRTICSGNGGHINDMGGRTLILHLDRGNTLNLYCDIQSHLMDWYLC